MIPLTRVTATEALFFNLDSNGSFHSQSTTWIEIWYLANHHHPKIVRVILSKYKAHQNAKPFSVYQRLSNLGFYLARDKTSAYPGATNFVGRLSVLLGVINSFSILQDYKKTPEFCPARSRVHDTARVHLVWTWLLL